MLHVTKIPGAKIVTVKEYQEKLRGKHFAILESLICLVYKPDLPCISKAQPVIRAVSAAPGLGVNKNWFDHQLASVIFGMFLSPSFLSCIPYVLLTAFSVHEDSEVAGRLLSCLGLWQLLQAPRGCAGLAVLQQLQQHSAVTHGWCQHSPSTGDGNCLSQDTLRCVLKLCQGQHWFCACVCQSAPFQKCQRNLWWAPNAIHYSGQGTRWPRFPHSHKWRVLWSDISDSEMLCFGSSCKLLGLGPNLSKFQGMTWVVTGDGADCAVRAFAREELIFQHLNPQREDWIQMWAFPPSCSEHP